MSKKNKSLLTIWSNALHDAEKNGVSLENNDELSKYVVSYFNREEGGKYEIVRLLSFLHSSQFEEYEADLVQRLFNPNLPSRWPENWITPEEFGTVMAMDSIFDKIINERSRRKVNRYKVIIIAVLICSFISLFIVLSSFRNNPLHKNTIFAIKYAFTINGSLDGWITLIGYIFFYMGTPVWGYIIAVFLYQLMGGGDLTFNFLEELNSKCLYFTIWYSISSIAFKKFFLDFISFQAGNIYWYPIFTLVILWAIFRKEKKVSEIK